MRILTTFIMVLFTITLFSQTTTLEGYIYESGNRGYLNEVSITAENMDTEVIVGKTKSDKNGFFQVDVPANSNIRIYAAKDMFDIKRVETKVGTGKAFLKLEMGRAPGYTFEVTLAEKKSSPEEIVDAITGTRIEVYNNTTRKSVMDLKDHDNPEFQLNLQKGNHYTILIRKNGFLSKRMEAKVDVEGCILCFEGVGNVGPGVSDNLTEGNAFGVLLANVELERIFEGKTMEIQSLYYDLGKWALKGSARSELKKVITLMKDNPSLTLELGSHTDSRGSSASNLELSRKRANSAVKFLIHNGGIAKKRIVSRGYGEDLLLNNCTNGVKCSENQHAINRRTELKIIGITDIKEVKSLAQMKKEEYMEDEILALMDQEPIRAKDEDELKRIIEADEKVAKDVERQIKNKEVNMKVSDNDLIFQDREIDEEAKKEVMKEAEEIKEKKSELSKDAQIFSDPKTKLEIEKELQRVSKPEMSQDIQVLEHDKTEMKEAIEVEVVEQQKESIENVITNAVSDGVTDGVKVVLFQSKTPLPKDHFIFLRHNEVGVFDNGDGRTFYMTGGFSNESEAFKFLNSFIRPDKKYKGSFVALIKDGVLAVVNQ